MWFDDAPLHVPPVLAETGTQQGLPIGRINFALPMQSRLERVAERRHDAPQLSFLDDCHTIGRADTCIAAVQDFLAECTTANLVDVPEKGKVFSFNAGAAARVAAALGYQDCS